MNGRKPMNLIRVLLRFSFFSIIGISTSVHAQDQLYDQIPIVETTQFELFRTEQGALTLMVKALEMCQYKNGNAVLNGNIEITVIETTIEENIDTEEKISRIESPTFIQADKLFYDKEQKKISLNGNVMITSSKKNIKITTEQLSYSIEKELIFTDAPITIINKKNILQGVGLCATKDLKKYTIHNPHGVLEEEQ
ncbi:LPS export ABC transporter periplasmic protein LptC [Cardinium endosymbiont of Culicoides punctatus]|uniref:LPS export ABC transporter periplasmic protein LptC n=1 Tax=Cardinium endosymbiont of Culicoides punctatus TaxID=2304601 RepID=UPI00195EF0C8|nr:LPS export ABC transporter periplasmic protein LptC [Cardinium endosymbiont of Culicoides punctatus]